MGESYRPALLGMLAAIAITGTMDATGYSMFSALPLLPLTLLFWYLQRFSRSEMGLVRGRVEGYGWALAYPLLVLGLAAAIAYLAGATATAGANWPKALTNIALMSSTGVIAVLLTEEGFFRGWLWASLKRAGSSDSHALIWTTLAFTAWHVSAIALDTGFDVPARQIPIYLVNATLLGAIFGMLRMASGSAVVPAVCHAVWNGIDYPLFGFGEKVGALGVTPSYLFGPEVGLLGVLLNSLFAVALWRWIARERTAQQAS